MTLSIFLGRFFGLYLVIIGIFYLARAQFIRECVREIFTQKAQIMFAGVISLIIGLLVVISHNVWVANWTVWITLLGYLTLLKGVLRLFLPGKQDRKFIGLLIRGHGPTYVGILTLLLGVFLTYKGFFEGI